MDTIKHTFTGLSNGSTYYGRVFTVNPKDRVNGRADLPFVTVVPAAFPAKPGSASEYTKYQSYGAGKKTFTAPEDGWYKVIVYGASGNGGSGDYSSKTGGGAFAAGGGGGGGGAVAISIVKMNKGDTIIFDNANIGGTSTATINATAGENYGKITVKSGESGGDGDAYAGGYFGDGYARGGSGGNGGEAGGGNYANFPGDPGDDGDEDSSEDASDYVSASGGYGGIARYAGGRNGGKGGGHYTSGGDGQTGYSEVYRGNTNVVA